MLKLLDKINFKIGRLFIGWRDKNPDDPFPHQEEVNADGYNPNDLNWELFVTESNNNLTILIPYGTIYS